MFSVLLRAFVLFNLLVHSALFLSSGKAMAQDDDMDDTSSPIVSPTPIPMPPTDSADIEEMDDSSQDYNTDEEMDF